jgi:aryl-alcohol dehydrogenase-like predicted oxidoreductase
VSEQVAAAAGTTDIGGDLTVNRLGFGAMRITGEGIWGDPKDRDQAKATLRRAVELGVNFIDTADSYGPDVSEILIAEALYPYPENLVIATKGGRLRPSAFERWPEDGRPEHLKEVLEGSLRKLRLEQIPLYQLHAPDPNVALEDSIGALIELKEQGKIRHIGVSNFTEEQIRIAQRLTPIVSIQNRYNIEDRSSESIVDLCEQERMVFLPWGPISSKEQSWDGRDIPRRDIAVVQDLAKKYGATPHQIVLAWLLARSPAMLPIPGTGSVSHVEENTNAASIKLTPAEVAALSEVK